MTSASTIPVGELPAGNAVGGSKVTAACALRVQPKAAAKISGAASACASVHGLLHPWSRAR